MLILSFSPSVKLIFSVRPVGRKSSELWSIIFGLLEKLTRERRALSLGIFSISFSYSGFFSYFSFCFLIFLSFFLLFLFFALMSSYSSRFRLIEYFWPLNSRVSVAETKKMRRLSLLSQ